MKNLKKLAESLTERELAELLRFKLMQYKAELEAAGGGDASESLQRKKHGKRGPGRPKGPKNRMGTNLGSKSG
jgi:ribosomal protein L19E